MRHEIPVAALGPQGPAMAEAVETCVHCGFCLPTCPTYRDLGEEMDSPRGRIVLMKESLEGKVELESALPYIDRCLGCLACVTSCPSGVEYGQLITAFRGHSERERHRGPAERGFRAGVLGTLPYPNRMAPLAGLGAIAKPLAGFLPAPLRTPLELMPSRPRRPRPLPELVAARGPRRARVAFLAGCVQQVIAQRINRATLRVLSRNGIEVVIPRGQACCGALPMHTGDQERARKLARSNLDAFGDGSAHRSEGSPDGAGTLDAVITNAAGCGAGMREYGLLFAGSADEERARALAGRVRDVAAFLDEIGLVATPPPLPSALTAAYHDACHLAHAQGVRAEPRRLLRAIPNLTLAEPAEWELCCGSAGTYNLEQPAIAERLGRRKAAHLEATGAGAIVAGNIGCLVQIGRFSGLPTYHTIELLDAAYRGRMPGGMVRVDDQAG
jgi:glycolate oxidase iron-sulfur subunit